MGSCWLSTVSSPWAITGAASDGRVALLPPFLPYELVGSGELGLAALVRRHYRDRMFMPRSLISRT